MKSKDNFLPFFIVLLCLHAAVVVLLDYFPFADVPSHLAEGTIYRYYNEVSNKFSNYYTLHYLFYPNTFHLFFFSLPIFPTVEIANKVLHLMVIVTLPVLVLLVIRQLQGNKWFAIAAFILVYSYNLTFGFTGNAVANNVMLLILWLWLRDVNTRANHFLTMVGISILLILVYYLHAMVALFCLLMMSAFLLYRYKNDFKGLLINSLCLVPLGSFIVYWWFFLQKSAENSAGYSAAETSTGAFMKEYYSSEFWLTYLDRSKFLVADNAQLFSGAAGKIVALLLVLIVIVPLLIFVKKYVIKNKKGDRDNLYGLIDEKLIYIFLFFIVSCFCYFVLPSRIPGQEPLYERFSTILVFSLIFLASKVPEVDNKVFSYAAVLVAVVHLVLWSQYLIQFNQENKDFAEILPQDNTKILSYMNYDPAYRGRMVYDHFQNYFIAKRKGISTSKVIDYRFGMIRRKESGVLPRQGHMYYRENPREQMLKSDYLLVRGDISARDQQLLDSLQTFKKVKDINQWHLLEKQR